MTSESGNGSFTALVVDDHSTEVFALIGTAAQEEGLTIDCIESPLEGLGELERKGYDLLIADLRFPVGEFGSAEGGVEFPYVASQRMVRKKRNTLITILTDYFEDFLEDLCDFWGKYRFSPILVCDKFYLREDTQRAREYIRILLSLVRRGKLHQSLETIDPLPALFFGRPELLEPGIDRLPSSCARVRLGPPVLASGFIGGLVGASISHGDEWGIVPGVCCGALVTALFLARFNKWVASSRGRTASGKGEHARELD